MRLPRRREYTRLAGPSPPASSPPWDLRALPASEPLRRWSANELFGPNPDQPQLLLPGIPALVEKGQQQPHRPGVQSFLARQVIAWGVGPVERHEVGEAHGHGDRAE